MRKATLDIIIVNWNAGHQLYDCIKSVASTNCDGFELGSVVIVDNASSDGSLQGLEDLGLSSLTILRNVENRGFAAACNQGAKGSKADYLLFLNPDTRLFKDSLVNPMGFMEHPNNHHIGIIGVQLIDDYGEVSCSCARFPTSSRFFAKIFGLDRLLCSLGLGCFMFEWDHRNNREVDQVMGAFFMVRRSLFKSLEGFDERFFVYCEEVDFSLRAQQAGWKSFYLAEAQAYHKGEAPPTK